MMNVNFNCFIKRINYIILLTYVQLLNRCIWRLLKYCNKKFREKYNVIAEEDANIYVICKM